MAGELGYQILTKGRLPSNYQPKGSEGAKIISGGKSYGTSGGGGISIDDKARLEAEAKLVEAKVKADAIAKQKSDAAANKARIDAERAEVERIKRLTPTEQQLYFREQANISRAYNTQELIRQGRTPTQSALANYQTYSQPQPVQNQSQSLSQNGFEETKELQASEEKAPFFQRIKTKAARGGFIAGATATTAGFVSPFIRTGKALISPIETAKSLIGAVKQPIVTAKAFRESTVVAFKTSPEFAIGQIGGEIALLKTPSLVTKGTDVIRTTGLKQIATEEVVAPEYFAGQTYPAIKRGQTAGQLKAEFKGAGYTASPKPFPKQTEALKGTSELPGVYQAPKVSPQFLRVGGEQTKFFSLSPVDTLRPTVTKIKPIGYELTPGIKSTQTRIAPLKPAKEFFEVAPKGKAYIPFVKTEKEAIIPFGTQLQQVGKEGYFKFEGRRVPIIEFEARTQKSLEVKPVSKVVTTKEVSTLSSSGRIQQRGLITPSEAISFSKSIPKRNVVSFGRVVSSSSIKTSRSFKQPISKISSSSIIKSSRTITSFGKGLSSQSFIQSGSSYTPPLRSPIITITSKQTFPFNKPGRTPRRSTTSKRKLKPVRRTPSLFAIGTGFKSSKLGNVESSGITIRPIIIKSKKKKKNGKKKITTD